MSIVRTILIFGAIVLTAGGCDARSPDGEGGAQAGARASGGRLHVAVSIQPQTYFVKRVGGEHVDVQSLLAPGQSHGAFDPTPRQVADMTRARAFFRIGVAFEAPLMERLREVAPKLEVVDTREGIELLALDGHHHHHDEGEPGGGQDNHACGDGSLDPHVWLDPVLVKTQARIIADTLSRLDQAHAGEYGRNLAAFCDELDRLHGRIAGLIEPHRGRAIVVFHPSFAYYCQRYGIRQVVIETEGKEPSARRLGELIEEARVTGARTVFAQEEYSTAGAKAVAEAIGGRVVRLAPMHADWPDNLLSMTEAIAAALAEARPPAQAGVVKKS